MGNARPHAGRVISRFEAVASIGFMRIERDRHGVIAGKIDPCNVSHFFEVQPVCGFRIAKPSGTLLPPPHFESSIMMQNGSVEPALGKDRLATVFLSGRMQHPPHVLPAGHSIIIDKQLFAVANLGRFKSSAAWSARKPALRKHVVVSKKKLFLESLESLSQE